MASDIAGGLLTYEPQINLKIDPEGAKAALTADFPSISESIIQALAQATTWGALLTRTAIVGNGANQVFPDQEYLDDVHQVKNPYTELFWGHYGTIFPFWDGQSALN